MAKAKQLSIDVLLVTVERPIPYLELHRSYKTDGSDVTVRNYFDHSKRNLDAGTTEPLEGIQYQTTLAGDVAIVWIELEDGTQAEITECFAWLKTVGEAWVKDNAGWKKQKDSSRQGYLGYPLQKKN